MDKDFTDDALREMIPRMRRFAISLTRNDATADDLVQACLERALVRRTSRQDAGDLRAWLFSILYRLFLDGQRRAKRYALVLSLFGVGSDEDSAPSAEDMVVARSALESFNKLSAEQRALLILVTVEGLSYREAADALDVPIGTIMSRISRARKTLREFSEGRVVPPSMQVLK
ncbi:DNA-directed RNA polymerase sigma subunit PrtI (ECF sigma factor) [Cupriavidus necator]|uniref:DNA-directed RNA polymerase sigma subunit PrtI (ECF sigma factor) n=1 Tax=Cupriavidus necator (strain ATCC 17699 / DSM 428 / KCTC 22496 / NCIMB 10442 / H16 / Stanier 337) TaxID=381666 RepID=Q0K0G4_CUPNH|nr:sigma-70 family RNA polymerase sigma factor [Cupriavidus necator]QCC04342.1 sigma-70 family RNA polymerase sigma factor [Cupriavidus necator H16]QQB79031.1 sigma-70 family RNA polymerase sigma factor [Cupriavidus necator]WKA43252.1 sigma-70 family RNA polymerase sigma factor [Cupriavidus necator]CAJ96510.1 DNA-directed RNA polymerase sigma subunit PrtI (ECF sigma factor) [Cupriavidus necator H16]